MSEENTAETNGSRSFQERVFARFDSVDNRLSAMDVRIEKLESKQYDTRPIWEQVLARLDSVDARLNSFDGRFEAIDGRFEASYGRFDALGKRLNAEFESIASRFESIDARFSQLDVTLENGLRGVERKIDVLSQDILNLRADHRFVNSRLDNVEEQLKSREG